MSVQRRTMMYDTGQTPLVGDIVSSINGPSDFLYHIEEIGDASGDSGPLHCRGCSDKNIGVIGWRWPYEFALERRGAAPVAKDMPNNRVVRIKPNYVPWDFVLYKCKISGGQVIELALPPNLTAEDVKRIHAFLLTQVDDENPPDAL